jgi:hypothetical protein
LLGGWGRDCSELTTPIPLSSQGVFSSKRALRANLVAKLICLALSSVALASLIACTKSSGQTSDCTQYVSSYTSDENDAIDQLQRGDYLQAFGKFAKAGQNRTECIYGTHGYTQAMNASYAAFDYAGEAAAAKRLGMDQDAAKLMSSARGLAAEVLSHRGLPAAVVRSMRKLQSSD